MEQGIDLFGEQAKRIFKLVTGSEIVINCNNGNSKRFRDALTLYWNPKITDMGKALSRITSKSKKEKEEEQGFDYGKIDINLTLSIMDYISKNQDKIPEKSFDFDPFNCDGFTVSLLTRKQIIEGVPFLLGTLGGNCLSIGAKGTKNIMYSVFSSNANIIMIYDNEQKPVASILCWKGKTKDGKEVIVLDGIDPFTMNKAKDKINSTSMKKIIEIISSKLFPTEVYLGLGGTGMYSIVDKEREEFLSSSFKGQTKEMIMTRYYSKTADPKALEEFGKEACTVLGYTFVENNAQPLEGKVFEMLSAIGSYDSLVQGVVPLGKTPIVPQPAKTLFSISDYLQSGFHGLSIEGIDGSYRY